MHDYPAFLARFWAKVDKGDGSGCWLWTAAAKPGGYGVVKLPGLPKRVARANRVSWEIANSRPCPPDLHVCHACDTPACVKTEPDARFPNGHLFLGDDLVNQRDKTLKGRHWNRACVDAPRGTAKIVDADAAAIRAMWSTGEYTQREIAARFGLAQGTVSRIVNGLFWRHVSSPDPVVHVV